VTTHMCYLIIKMPFQIFVTSFYSTHLTFFWVETFVFVFVCMLLYYSWKMLQARFCCASKCDMFLGDCCLVTLL